jgi:hypothetical protein
LLAIYDEKQQAVILLFHRASPNAADPMYRRKTQNREITVRPFLRQDLESSLLTYDEYAC